VEAGSRTWIKLPTKVMGLAREILIGRRKKKRISKRQS